MKVIKTEIGPVLQFDCQNCGQSLEVKVHLT